MAKKSKVKTNIFYQEPSGNVCILFLLLLFKHKRTQWEISYVKKNPHGLMEKYMGDGIHRYEIFSFIHLCINDKPPLI